MHVDQLMALPITGELFLLRRGEHYILVDGGGRTIARTHDVAGRALAAALKRLTPSLTKIDIVVCPHSDSDHALPLLSF